MRIDTGNICVMRKVHISERLPGKLNREIAYPAVADMVIPMTIVNAATTTELRNHVTKSVEVSSRW